MFTLSFKTSNAAFCEDDPTEDDAGELTEARAAEIARILRELAARIAAGISDDSGSIYDVNGNRVGHFEHFAD